MDLKSLLNESSSLRSAIETQTEIDALKRSMSAGVGGELARVQSMLNGTSGGLEQPFTSIAEREAAKFLKLGTGDIPGFASGRLDTVESLARRHAEMSLGVGSLDLSKGPRDYGAMDWEESIQAANEREDTERLTRSFDLNQHVMRDAAEARRREDAKLEYARRSAEASEEALAEERRKRGVAELAAQQAKVQQDKAEARADRAERRETRMERWAIYAIVVALIAAAITVVPFLKE